MSKVVRTDLTAEEADQLLAYDSQTGIIRWRVGRPGRPHGYKSPGTEAGSTSSDGGHVIMVNGLNYPAARIAFLLMTGGWPPDDLDVDHINRNRSDNRWSNLRLATRQQNQANKINRNASGFKGICWEASRRKYKAYIEVGGRSMHLGRFETAEEAHEAYASAAKKYFGEYARTKE